MSLEHPLDLLVALLEHEYPHGVDNTAQFPPMTERGRMLWRQAEKLVRERTTRPDNDRTESGEDTTLRRDIERDHPNLARMLHNQRGAVVSFAEVQHEIESIFSTVENLCKEATADDIEIGGILARLDRLEAIIKATVGAPDRPPMVGDAHPVDPNAIVVAVRDGLPIYARRGHIV